MIYSYILCLLLESTHGLERSLSVAAYSMPEYSEPYYTYTHTMQSSLNPLPISPASNLPMSPTAYSDKQLS